METIEHLATRSLAQAERLDYWNRILSETFSGLCVDSERATFNAEMWRWKLGPLTMIRPRSPNAIVHRWADGAHDNSDQVILHLQHAGQCIHHQAGQSHHLRAGDFALADSSKFYRLELNGVHDMLVVEMPRAMIADRVTDFEAKLSQRIAGATPGARLLHDFLLSLWRQGDQSHLDPQWVDGVAGVFLDMVALAMAGVDAPASVGGRIQKKLASLIEARLHDPELRTASLAAELDVSMRTVQNVFASMGTTPSGYILERRLERAADRLIAEPTQSITVIALELGFNDCSYFTRSFRQRFGVSPSAYRARH